MKVLLPILSAVLLATACSAPSTSASIGLPTSLPLGSVDVVVHTDDIIGYRRDVHVDVYGAMSVVYVRETADGREVSVERSEFEEFVYPTLERMAETLPETSLTWIETCSVLRDEVARLAEGGASFRGGGRTGVVGPYFWCEPRAVVHELKNVGERAFPDPLDTLAVFLVTGYEALTPHAAGRRVEHRAERIAYVASLFEEQADCFEQELLSSSFGGLVQRWTAALERAGGDTGVLAAMLVEDPELAAWE